MPAHITQENKSLCALALCKSKDIDSEAYDSHEKRNAVLKPIIVELKMLPGSQSYYTNP